MGKTGSCNGLSMSRLNWASVWIILILQFLNPISCSIWCYQCIAMTAKDPCVTNPPLPLEGCNESFCLKTVMLHPNGTLMTLSRSCTSIAMPSYCSTGQLDGDRSDPANYDRKKNIKLCTFFCSSNYCNSAGITTYSIITLFSAFFMRFLIG